MGDLTWKRRGTFGFPLKALRFKTLFAAFGEAQPLLITFEARLNPSPR